MLGRKKESVFFIQKEIQCQKKRCGLDFFLNLRYRWIVDINGRSNVCEGSF
jgi:hypothetical protein